MIGTLERYLVSGVVVLPFVGGKFCPSRGKIASCLAMTGVVGAVSWGLRPETTGDIHHPVFQPFGIGQVAALAVAEHGEFIHQPPYRPCHYTAVVGGLQEGISFLQVIQYYTVEPVVGCAAGLLCNEAYICTGKVLPI